MQATSVYPTVRHTRLTSAHLIVVPVHRGVEKNADDEKVVVRALADVHHVDFGVVARTSVL